MRLNSLCLLPSSWHSSAGFPYFFAAIARGPLAFATRWIWAADIAESIETAAVRAPLCAPFWDSGEAFLAGAVKRELIPVDPALTLDFARHLVANPRLQLLGGDFQLPIGQVWSCQIGLAGYKHSLRLWPEVRIRVLVAGLTTPCLLIFYFILFLPLSLAVP